MEAAVTGVDQQPVGGGAGSTPPSPAASTVVPQRPTPALLRLVKRLPFTTFYVVVTLVLAIALGTLWTGIEDKSWYSGRRLRAAGVRGRSLAHPDLGQLLRAQPVLLRLRRRRVRLPHRLLRMGARHQTHRRHLRRLPVRRRAAHRAAVPDLPGFRLGLGGAAGHRDRRRVLGRDAGRAQRGQRDRPAALAAAAAAGASGPTCCSRSSSSGRWPTPSTSSRSR